MKSLLAAALLLAAGTASAAETHARVDDLTVRYTLASDLSYVEEGHRDDTLLTARGLRLHDRATFDFHPDTESVRIVEAWTDEPDGTRVPVTEANMFTRPSQATQNAPGFTSTHTTTVLFPRLREGARTHVAWRFVRRTPAVIGFASWDDPPVEEQVAHMRVTVDAPAETPIHWGQRGFAVADRTEGARHVIDATIDAVAPEEPEHNMVAWSDVRPIFVATTLDSLEQLGALYYRQSVAQARPTPEIAALAHRIAGDRTGIDAARAVYDYVARRIRYVAVYLDPQAGWVPHDAAEVARNGYGDCKDHVVLMQALLAALGIRAQAAIVDWGTAFRPAPVWSPFQFNHAIVYLPDYDMFANPTNPYARFEALDRRLSGKQVVIATQDGRVSRTPDSTPQGSAYRYTGDLRIAADGTVDGRAEMRFSASLDSDARGALALAPSRIDLADKMLGTSTEGGFGDIASSDPDDLDTPLTVTATWRSPHGVPVREGAMSMQLSTGIDFKRAAILRALLTPDHLRRHPLLAGALDYEWCVTVHLPPGRTLAELPTPVEIENEAGRYTAAYELAGNELRVVRHLTILRDVFPAEETPALEALTYAALDDARAIVSLVARETSYQR